MNTLISVLFQYSIEEQRWHTAWNGMLTRASYIRNSLLKCVKSQGILQTYKYKYCNWNVSVLLCNAWLFHTEAFLHSPKEQIPDFHGLKTKKGVWKPWIKGSCGSVFILNNFSAWVYVLGRGLFFQSHHEKCTRQPLPPLFDQGHTYLTPRRVCDQQATTGGTNHSKN